MSIGFLRYSLYRNHVNILTKNYSQAFEDERRQHRDLKHTWQRANDQFLEAQRLHLADMRRMQSLLTVDQQRKLEGEEVQATFSKTLIYIFGVDEE